MDMKKCLAVFLGLMMCLAPVLGAVAEETENRNDYTVGSIVTFGVYEQDNNEDNGEEAIEWLVLAVDGDRALLLSLYGLDARPYATYLKRITWVQSSIRLWLNYTFIKDAFTPAQRERILISTVANENTPGYDSYNCGDTEDQIFLLSYEEAIQYFPEDIDRVAQPTAYAIANGVYTDDETGNGWWWLRSPGVDNTYACAVRTGGYISGYGTPEVNRTTGMVRPAIWLNIGETSAD